jgi:hypothetical protein
MRTVVFSLPPPRTRASTAKPGVHVELAAAGQDMCTQRRRALGRGPDDTYGVFVPGCLDGRIRDPTPQVDNRSAVDGDRDGSPTAPRSAKFRLNSARTWANLSSQVPLMVIDFSSLEVGGQTPVSDVIRCLSRPSLQPPKVGRELVPQYRTLSSAVLPVVDSPMK